MTLLSLRFSPDETSFDTAEAFGVPTESVYGHLGGYPIHCSSSLDIDTCLEGQRVRGAEAATLWLGNSQLHEINQRQPEDATASVILFNKLAKINLDLLTVSFGNASLQEHYLMFEYMRTRMPLKLLILPVVFDDTRELGVRADLEYFVRYSQDKEILSKTTSGAHILRSFRAYKEMRGMETNEQIDTSKTLQEKAENTLNKWLDTHVYLWQLRPEIRGWLMLTLYKIRNFVLRIEASTTRRVIRSRYKVNMRALEDILDSALTNNIRVLTYIAPIRGDKKIPYDLSEYGSFKSEVKALCQKYNSSFKNLELLVPDNAWGMKASTTLSNDYELDFMHFAYPGHVILAENLSRYIISSAKPD